jgi:N-acylneuraminate cytidylyltransferase
MSAAGPRVAAAIVLARGGSKGVPRKNAAPVAGRPCVAWTLEAAVNAASVARTVLSTDDGELAVIARGMGVDVVTRPADLATDTARVDDAARHALNELAGLWPEAARGGTPVVILYGNVPLRPAGLIDRAVTLLVKTGCDSVQSYAAVGKYHPWWTARVEEHSGRVAPWEGEVLNHGVYRRQDLPPAYVPDGGVLVVTRRALMGEIAGVAPGPHAFFGLDRRGVINPVGAVVDIDSPVDLLVADAALRARATGPAA